MPLIDKAIIGLPVIINDTINVSMLPVTRHDTAFSMLLYRCSIIFNYKIVNNYTFCPDPKSIKKVNPEIWG